MVSCKMAKKLLLRFFFLYLVTEFVGAEVFYFGDAEHVLSEVAEPDNVYTSVRIIRDGSDEEASVATSITLTTDCPVGVQATATPGTDYTVPTTVTFDISETFKDIQITIVDDSEEEFRKFFCLSITTNPGAQYSTKIYIPGNDYCVQAYSSPLGSAPALDPTTTGVAYVGPWLVGEDGIPDTFDFDVSPQSMVDGGEGEQLNIFLKDTADMNTVGSYYAISLDIVDPIDDLYNGNGVAEEDSIIEAVRNGPAVATFVANINDNTASGIDVVATAGDSFSLQYTESSGQFLLTDTGDNQEYSGDDPDTPIDVSHVFVSSGNNDYARWTVCGMLPRKLPAVSASASGYEVGYAPTKAMDNDRNTDGLPNTGCFVSSSVTDPWLQIDLGREFDVMMVLIWPVTSDGTNANPDWLDNADVYVGSCPSTSGASITSNTLCDNNIGDIGNGESVITVSCNPESYGRYVYIHQDTISGQRISLCEVEVYGDDIPLVDEATVEFSSATFQTANDESAEYFTISATRSGTAPTCTSVELYTDASGIIDGTTTDFTPVLSTNPVTLSWTATGSSTQIYEVVVVNDHECESEETFNVFLKNVDGGVLGTQSSATASIIDNDSVTYALSSSIYTVAEGSSVDIEVIRSGIGTMQSGSAGLVFTDISAQDSDYTSSPATVTFTATSDDTQAYALATVDDEIYEAHESFNVALGTLTPSCSFAGSPDAASVTITDNDSQFTFDIDDATLTIPEGTSMTTLTIKREGLVQAKTVDIVVDEVSADDSTDFIVSESSVTFSINDASRSVIIDVEDDSIVEGDESFTLTLQDPNYTDGNGNLYENYRVTVVIPDNDATYTWKQEQYSIAEDGGSLDICLLRSGDTTTLKTIALNTVSGTATSGADFTAITDITFNANTESCGTIHVENDGNVGNVEDPEVFTVWIVEGQQDVEIGVIQTATITITDDDSVVSWESSSYTFSESSKTNIVKIIKTGSGSRKITIQSNEQTATQGVDFQPVSVTMTITDPSTDFPVTIHGDDINEPSETFSLTLSGSGIISSVTRITIDDDDPAPTTQPPDDRLGGGAIAGIIVAAGIAAIAIIVAIVIAYIFMSRRQFTAPTNKRAGPATGASKATAGVPAGYQGYPLANYAQPGGLPNYDNNAFYLDYANQQFGGFDVNGFGYQ